MGLDMYAYTCDAKDIGDQQVDIKLFDDKGEPRFPSFNREFAYWRKFNNLHEWMKDLYIQKGGVDPSFNCNTVRLNEEDLIRLSSQARHLKPASGFFWGGEEEMTDEMIEEVKQFVKKAKLAIDEGQAVIYDSWW